MNLKLRLLAGFLFFSASGILNAQVSVTASLGTASGVYPTLGDAFSKLNDGTHKGVVQITISENTTEAATAVLDSSGNPTGSAYSAVVIKPLAGVGITVSGAIAGPLVVLNGADNVQFDGLKTGGASMVISNTETASGASTVRFINDANNNSILNATIRGAGSSSSSGVIHFSTGLASGNDGNKIANCDIDGTGLAQNCFFSSGSITSAELQNSSDTIQNCNVYDFFNGATFAPTGVLLSAGNTGWLISGNSFYQTISRTSATQTMMVAVSILSNFPADAHRVLNNYCGGTAPNAANTFTLSGSGTNVVGYQGFNILASGTGNLTQGNMIRNVTISYSGSFSFSNAGLYAAISGYDGVINFNSNTIENFNVTNGGGPCAGGGILVNGKVTTASTTVKPVFNLTNNVINNLAFNTTGTNNCQYYGIRIEVSSSGGLTSNATSNPNFIISGNTISNLSCTNGGTTGYVRAIGLLSSQGTTPSTSTATFWPKASIRNNIISNVSMNSPYASSTSATAVGINFLGYTTTAYTTDSTIISGNTISEIKSTNTGDYASLVAGIYVTNGLYGITQNKIFNLSNSCSGATAKPFVAGINSRGIFGTGSTYIANNFISLGKNAIGESYPNNVSYFGILNNFSTSRVHIVCYNTVIIDGTVGTGAYNSACYHRGVETFSSTANQGPTNLKNNIFINLRNGGTGSHYAVSGGGGTNVLASDYNDFFAANTATVGYWNSTAQTFANFQTNSAGDANSKNVAVTVVNASSGDLHLSGTSNGDFNLRGTTLADFNTDFDGETRSSNPYMGGDEASITLPLQLLSFTGQINGNRSMLSWVTCCENNTAFFYIERSTDGRTWMNSGNVKAKGSNVKNEYSFADANLSNGKYYYRLKIVDGEGKALISKIVLLELNGKLLFTLHQNYPNPVRDITAIQYQLASRAAVKMDIFSLDGRKVATIQNKIQDAGSYNVQFNAGQFKLSTGTYIYRLMATDPESGNTLISSREMSVFN